MDVKSIQAALRAIGADGWLLCDFRKREVLAYQVLGLDFTKKYTRRWYYFIPAKGQPKKLVSAIETRALDSLPGSRKIYTSWKELHAFLAGILGDSKRIAMQYSPRNHVPFVAMVDAGTVELVRSFGHKVVSSADLVQSFVAAVGEDVYQLHKEAGVVVDRIRAEAFEEIGSALASGRRVTEYDIQQFIMRRFGQEGLTTYSPPMVGVNDHPADPHFEVSPTASTAFKAGDSVLIDLWAKRDVPRAIYYDSTWLAYIGDKPPVKFAEIFGVVRAGRDAAIAFIQKRISQGRACHGWEADDACRNVIKKAGYGKYFVHRTGHSIGEDTHGSGVNIDNLETKDERRLVPGCCFSIEPGIYLPGKTAARTEINMFIRHDGMAEVTGEIQRELVQIPAK